MSRKWGFATWVSDAPTGGNVYDRRLIAELLARGVDLQEHRVTGPWPHPSSADRKHLADLLLREPRWLVDAIVACAAPEEVRATLDSGRPVVVLVHSFMSDETWTSPEELQAHGGAERTVLRAATSVVCTSRWAAEEVARRSGRTDAGVAPPGIDPAPAAPGSLAVGAARILALGTVCARKDQLTLVHALAGLADLPWSARIVGADDVEPGYATGVRAAVARSGLADRVEVVGARSGPALEAEWHAADLLVLTSRSETYGMVVVEALARGIPCVVTAGTGAEEAQLAGGVAVRPGGTAAPGDPAAVAEVLRRWLSDRTLRDEWREAARAARTRLPSWASTARAVALALSS